jgi:hypothetical protein
MVHRQGAAAGDNQAAESLRRASAHRGGFGRPEVEFFKEDKGGVLP